MPRQAELVTFDCYGTLIDWRSGIAEAFGEVVPGSREIAREQLFASYAAAEANVESGAYRSYRQVLAEAGCRTAEALGLRVPASRRYFLAESLTSWTPFPDTNPALERLASLGIRLGILSNIDDDLLAGTLEHFTVPFDLLVTAERLRSYKPALAHFKTALKEVDGRVDRLVHAAESYYHDVRPAQPLGIRTVWVNRTALDAPGPVRPWADVRDLAGAAEAIARLRPSE